MNTEELLTTIQEMVKTEVARELALIRKDQERREQAPRLLRLGDVQARTGYSGRTIWRLCQGSQFPKPVKLGPRVTAWREWEVMEWVNNHAA